MPTVGQQDEIQQLREEYGLAYHVPYTKLADQILGFKGKRVLEVGGSLPQRYIEEQLGAEQWVSVEEAGYWNETAAEGEVYGMQPSLASEHKKFTEATPAQLTSHNLYFGSIEQLPPALEGYFDIVFTIAAFEHIARLPLALEKMYSSLKPGGHLFSLFSPVWSCYIGHHLPFIVDKHGKRWAIDNIPIPPWGHLLLKPADLYDMLLGSCDKETAQEVIYYVYSSPHINRFFLDDYIDLVARSPFKTIELKPLFPSNVPDIVQRNLETRYPGRKDFCHTGLLMILERDA